MPSSFRRRRCRQTARSFALWPGAGLPVQRCSSRARCGHRSGSAQRWRGARPRRTLATGTLVALVEPGLDRSNAGLDFLEDESLLLVVSDGGAQLFSDRRPKRARSNAFRICISRPMRSSASAFCTLRLATSASRASARAAFSAMESANAFSDSMSSGSWKAGGVMGLPKHSFRRFPAFSAR